MRLSDFLKAQELDEAGFAAKSDGAFSAEAVRKWRFGARVPRPRQMAIISRLTDGRVTASDFYAHAAEVAERTAEPAAAGV